MKATFNLTNPGAVECSMTMMMKLDEWKRLRAELPNIYPGWVLRAAIDALVAKAEARFESEGTYPPPEID